MADTPLTEHGVRVTHNGEEDHYTLFEHNLPDGPWYEVKCPQASMSMANTRYMCSCLCPMFEIVEKTGGQKAVTLNCGAEAIEFEVVDLDAV
jgi:hypothetical protein